MVSSIKCVIFDFGDTLVKSSEATRKTRQAFPESKVFKKLGLKFSKKQLKKAFRQMEEKSKQIPTAKRLKDPVIYGKLFLECLGLKATKKLALECENAFYAEKEKHTTLMPFAKETLEFLKKNKIAIAVVSNTRNNSNLKIAKKLGIKKHFKAFLMSHAFGSVKSELKIFHALLEKINKKRKKKILANECLMVGNNVLEDGAAKTIGMKVAILKPTLTGKEHLEKIKPDYLLNDLTEIKKIIEGVKK